MINTQMFKNKLYTIDSKMTIHCSFSFDVIKMYYIDKMIDGDANGKIQNREVDEFHGLSSCKSIS